MRMLPIVVVCPVLAVVSVAGAQQFTRLDAGADDGGKELFIDTQAGVKYAVEFDALTKLLGDAPGEGGPGLLVELPTPWGDTQTFEVHASPIMEAGLAEKLPGTMTFTARGVDDRSAWGRFDVSNQGLRAMIRSETGAWYIDPAFVRDRDHVVSYYLRDYVMENPARALWECGTHDDGGGVVPVDDGAGFDVSRVLGPGVAMRQFRIAMSCMGEYGAYHSTLMGNAPNAVDPMNAIVTNVNRVNTVFEADAGVRFVLVANNMSVVFFDAATDPFSAASCDTPSSDCSVQAMEANQSVLDGAIGTANYDVGHVLTRVPGGVANLNAACRADRKAKGASGIPRGGDNDPVGALVSVHELGHQFSAQHTFNGTRGRCAGNISANNAYEPGSGSTQMAYPGGCPVGDAAPTDNVAIFADPYFHGHNVGQITSFLTTVTASCAQLVQTSNQQPIITSITPTVTVPPMTAFTLRATVSDDSPNVTYCFEQYDRGVGQPLTGTGSADNGTSPLFRSFLPSASNARTFPRMSVLLNGEPDLTEEMPSVSGTTRKFRLTVRDNQGGVLIAPNINVNIAGTQAFAVTSVLQVAQEQLEVRWAVAGTNAAPFGVSSVRVTMSVDGGQTWSLTLANATANDGVEVFTVPGVVASDCRVRVEAVGNAFFAVSQAFAYRPLCDTIDFNNNGVFPEDQDVADFFRVLAGEQCAACSDIDFNNDSVFPDDLDVMAFFAVLAGGTCW